MKRLATACVFLLFTAVFLVATSNAQSESISPLVLTNTCFSCHGTDGKSRGAMPAIAGKPPEYIVRMLTEFRDEQREATVMNRIAKGFSDAEIEALAQFFSAE